MEQRKDHCVEWQCFPALKWQWDTLQSRGSVSASVHPPHMHICAAWAVDMVPFCHCCCFSFCSFMEKQMNVCPLPSPGRGGRALCSFLCKICPALGILCLKQQKEEGPFTQLQYLSLPLPRDGFDPNLCHSFWPKSPRLDQGRNLIRWLVATSVSG